MKLLRRQINILRYINDNPQINIKKISEIMKVSMHTIKTDLENMKNIMADYNIKMDILEGNSLNIQGYENLIYMLKESTLMLEFSLENQVLLIMLLNEGFVVLQDIADKLYVSKSFIEKLMAVILRKYNEELQSVRHYGIRNIASEIEKRSRFVEIMSPYIQGIDFEEELKQFDIRHFPVLQYLKKNEITNAIKAIEYLQNIKFVSFTDQAICQIFLQFIYIQVSYHNMKNIHKGIFANIIDELNENNIYLSVGENVCQILGIENKDEKKYICYLFMTLRKQQMHDSKKIVDKMDVVVFEIFKKIYDQLAISLQDDHELLNGLAVHIYTTVLRKDRFQITTLDYSWNDIRHQYPLGFEMAAIAADVILKKFIYKVSNDEMTYLTLHFQAAIERIKNKERKINVLVICHYGMAAASLIASKLERIFSAVNIVDTISMQHFIKTKEINADLILSTENIKTENIPVIYVTPLLVERELKQINNFINNHCINNLLTLAIMDAKILNLDNCSSKNKILETVASLLYEDGIVTENYIDSVLERENISSTDVDSLAFPHGNPDFVKKTKLVIIRLSTPIHWVVSDVSYIFLFAVSKEQFVNNFGLFSTFYKKLVNCNIRNEIQKIGKKNEEDFKSSLAHLLT